MSEVQRYDDVGTVLRLLPHFLRLEMHQLWCHHRSDHFGEPSEEPRRTRRSTGCDPLIRLTQRSVLCEMWWCDDPSVATSSARVN